MPSLSRKGNNACIYWVTGEQADAQLPAGVSSDSTAGYCSANKYFDPAKITCYNSGACDGSGTCIGCSSYDIGGLKFSQKDTTKVFTDAYLMVWNEEQQKYLYQRKASVSERADLNAFSSTLTPEEKLTTYNYNDIQVPMNLAIYNMRAKVKKCCNWNGSPIIFSKTRNGNLYITVYVGSTAQTYRYTGVPIPSAFCSVVEAEPWLRPESGVGQNNSSYPCNGCKPECPYYTGPTWRYCIDDKMEIGDKISAAQIMELRYYSDDWKSMNDPQTLWNKRFKDPQIWSWSGNYVGKETGDIIVEGDIPLVSLVHIDNFKSSEPEIIIDSPIPVTAGITVTGKDVTFPTLIKEIGDVSPGISIAWPKSTTSEPFIFRTFRAGQNKIRVLVNTAYTTSLYAVNLTKHPQGDSDSDFISDLLRLYPDDIYTWTSTDTFNGVPYFDVDLEYGGNVENVNVIKVFVRDPTSTTGTFLTAYCHVKHIFHHAIIAQTSGKDYEGYKRIQPWIDRFEHVKCEAEIFNMTGNVTLSQVLWDTYAGNKLTMYPIEIDVENELQSSSKWHVVSCSMIALEISNLSCNCVFPFKLSGSSVTGKNVNYGVFLYRADNTVYKLSVVYKSGDGTFSPANVIFARVPPGVNIGEAINEETDVIRVTYAYTEYRPCPVLPEDFHRLKYPSYRDQYLSFMPVEISTNISDMSFTAEGSFVEIKLIQDGQVAATEKFYNLDSIKDSITSEIKYYENMAVSSFEAGGANDDLIKTFGYTYSQVERVFNEQYGKYVFSDDNTTVTLSRMCEHLTKLINYEGAYRFICIFNDDTGRPAGIKRIYMTIQSALVETRDTEIFYKWSMNRQWWPILDLNFLLADLSLPSSAFPIVGDETYLPSCGDHCESAGGDIFRRYIFGDPGPMWYPYNRCEEPIYYETGDVSVACSNYVEGFGPAYGDLRFSYWEKMRGPDAYRTVVDSPIYLLGCTWSDLEYTVQTINDQKFTGYTRIRSSHPLGPFGKDREALHINRHYIKRNLKVRNEIVQNEDNDLDITWSDPYTQIAFDGGVFGGAEKVGSSVETPVWVHITDGVSDVDYTTDGAQHPFTHYLLKNVGSVEQNEAYDYTRYKLKDVIKDRDLTTTVQRDTNGTVIYSPGEPEYIAGEEGYSDLVPVFTDKNISWAWLEKPKEIVRGSGNNQITGITLYNPTESVWKTDKESAVYTEEGTHPLDYLAPTFDENTGSILTLPAVSWAGGPSKEINWYTGRWITDNTPYDYRKHTNVDNFKLYGKYSDSTTSYFIADDSGIHKYVNNITVSGVSYGHTYRGFGVNPYIAVEDLPYSLTNYTAVNYSDVTTKVRATNNRFQPSADNTLFIGLHGCFYVEYVKVAYKYGVGSLSSEYITNHSITGSPVVRFDIPSVVIKTENFDTGVITETTNTSYIRAPSLDGMDLPRTLDDDSIIYNGSDGAYRSIVYNVGVMCTELDVSFGDLKGDAYAFIDSFDIMYRRPEDRSELVTHYEQRVNVSRADSGETDYRNLLYYYNRTVASYGDSLAYTASTDSALPSVKFTNRSVKDVILEYEYSDPTGTRFAYKDGIRPESNPDTVYDLYGVLSYQPSVDVHTKGRTLIARAHVDDCPQILEDGNINSEPVAGNENSSCGSTSGSGFSLAGDLVLNEGLPKCLYDDAKTLTLGVLDTVYEWFWHPDEITFWASVGVDTSKFSVDLTLSSTIPPINRLFEHESYGCSSNMSVPYFDGIVHTIPTWQALGHTIKAENPLYNDACRDVVVHKVGRHLGEVTYGTDGYGDNSSGNRWPWEAPKDWKYYKDSGLVDKQGTYYGGAVGGVFGGAGIAAQDYGGAAQSTTAAEEIFERTVTARTEGTRADASRRGVHQPS